MRFRLPHAPLALLLLLFELWVGELRCEGEPAYTYSPSTYCAVEMKVVRLSLFVYRCSSL